MILIIKNTQENKNNNIISKIEGIIKNLNKKFERNNCRKI